MKKIIFCTLSIIILCYFFAINNYKNFGEVIHYKIKRNEKVFIEEVFKTKSNKVEVSKDDFNELIYLISETKYRKIVPYTLDPFATKYEITSNDNHKRINIIVDGHGLGLRLEGNNLERYIIRDEKLNIILDYLETIVDKSDTKEGNVTKLDFEYINTNLAKEISMIELLRRINIDLKSIIIKSIDLSLSGNGYISSINMIFFNHDNTEKIILVYKESGRTLKINKFKNQNKEALKATNNAIILNALDYLLKEPNDLKDYRSKRLINLYKPYKTSISNSTEALYYNGKVSQNNERKGIVFSIIDLYSSKDSTSKFHIFDGNLESQK